MDETPYKPTEPMRIRKNRPKGLKYKTKASINHKHASPWKDPVRKEELRKRITPVLRRNYAIQMLFRWVFGAFIWPSSNESDLQWTRKFNL